MVSGVPAVRIRTFSLLSIRTLLPGRPDHAPASASCLTIFTSSRSPGRASAGRPGTMLRRGPSRTIGPTLLDVFEAWFGDVFDEQFGPYR